jgi:hypothetical protein
MTSSLTVAVTSSPLTVFHRGFAIALRHVPGRFGPASFGYAIRHDGLVLHETAGAYGSPSSAVRAARCFVDDALGAFEHACCRREVDA